MDIDDAVFPYNKISLDKVAILFDRCIENEEPLDRHTALPLPPPTTRRVAILLDGICSSSTGLSLSQPARWIEDDTICGLEVCVFNYTGISSRFYQERDTVHADFDTLVQYLDEHVDYYKNAQQLILVGYSFGGLIISEWLYRHRDDIQEVSNLRGVCFVASPIRVQGTRVHYERERLRTKEARDHVSLLIKGYTAIPEHIHRITPTIIFRCETDNVLDVAAYTFADLEVESRPLVELEIDSGVNHQTIVVSRDLKRELLKVLAILSNSMA